MDVKLNRRSFLAGMAGMIAGAFPRTANGQGAGQNVGLRPPGRFGDINTNTIYDVCIIGSGFAGAVLGDALVKHGIKTVILESGPDPRGKSIDPRLQQLNAFRSVGPIDYPVNTSRFRGVGGTSWLWGGICTRLHPKDFERSAYSGASWPIGYKDLEPFYRRAEVALRVRGGRRSKYDPPLKDEYPLPPDRDVSPLEAMLAKIGIIVSDMPYSTSENSELLFLSDRYGPRVRMTERLLPSFQNSAYGILLSDVTVTRLLAGKSGVISGAEIRDLERNVKILRARVYVVACGGLESPRLLLLSRASEFPNGIGNNHDLVGRFFTEHRPASLVGGVKLGWNTFNFFALKGMSYQFYEKFKDLGLGGMRLAFHLEGAMDSKEILSWHFTKPLNRIFTRRLDITVGTEMKPTSENRVTLDKRIKDYFGSPVGNLFLKDSEDDIRTVERGKQIARRIFTRLGVGRVEELPRNFWGHHHMGTCRMGDNPRTSVIDRNLQVHGTKNLFVAGSSAFVTSGTVHPTLSLTALSLRLADFLGARLANGAFQARSINRGRRLTYTPAEKFE